MEEKHYSRPVTQKVRGGSISSAGLCLKTNIGDLNFPWNDVHLICVGRILETFEKSEMKPESSGSSLVGNVPFIGRMVKDSKKETGIREDYYIALLFTRSVTFPLRFDTRATNFKELLGPQAGYAAEINFCACINSLIQNSSCARLDDSTQKFITNGKKWIKQYNGLDVFMDHAWKEKSITPNEIAPVLPNMPEEFLSDDSDDIIKLEGFDH